MNIRTSQVDECTVDPALPEDFSWAEIVSETATPIEQHVARGSVLLSGVRNENARAPEEFLSAACSPAGLADSGRFQQWLLCHGFAEVSLPVWAKADYWEWRDLILTIRAMLPGIRISIGGPTSPEPCTELHRLATQWPDEVRLLGKRDLLASGKVRNTRAGGKLGNTPSRQKLVAELTKVVENLRRPEPSDRVEAKLAHLREGISSSGIDAESQIGQVAGHFKDSHILRMGAAAANSVIPGSGKAGAGLHIGSGFVLRPWSSDFSKSSGLGCARAGFHLMQVATDIAPIGGNNAARHVAFDPRPGKMLKHEHAHALFVGEDGRVRVASSALTALGQNESHLFLATENPAAQKEGSFYFNESWQFIGMGVDVIEPDEVNALSRPAVAVLRTGAIWEILVGLADIGSGPAADALRTLDLARAWQRRALAPRGQEDRSRPDVRALVRGGFGG